MLCERTPWDPVNNVLNGQLIWRNREWQGMAGGILSHELSNRLVAIQFTTVHLCRKGLESKAPFLLLLPILFTTKILLTA